MHIIFCDSLKYCESVSLKQCGHPQPTFLLCPDKLRAAEESLIVTKNGFETKVLTLVLIPDLHSVVAPHLLQIFNQMPEISVDVIPRLLWPRYQYWHRNIFPFVGQPRRKVQNRQHNWLG
jgi:hypothetical protein